MDEGGFLMQLEGDGRRSRMSSTLWRVCMRYGRIVDAFVPSKKDRMGVKFGFVRFLNDNNIQDILYKLNGIAFNGRYLKANVARYSRSYKVAGDERKQEFTNENDMRKNERFFDKQKGFEVRRNMSFRDVVVGNASYIPISHKRNENSQVGSTCNGEKSLKINIPDTLKIEYYGWLKSCLIGELKDLDMLSKYFSNHRVASAFLSEHRESWSYWFVWLNKWDWSYCTSYRALWIKVFGVLIAYWDHVTFQVIASNFVKVLISVECNSDATNFSFGRLCILTVRMKNLNVDNIKDEDESYSDDGVSDTLSKDSNGESSFVEDFDNLNSDDELFMKHDNVPLNTINEEDGTSKVQKVQDDDLEVSNKVNGNEGALENSMDDSSSDNCNSTFFTRNKHNYLETDWVSSNNNDIGPNSCGPDKEISPYIPDLNNPTFGLFFSVKSDNIHKPQKAEIKGNRKVASVKQRDIILIANRKKKRPSKSGQSGARGNHDSSRCGQLSLDAMGSSSMEIRKTIEVGSSIGYNLDGAEKIIQDML
ncbi:hypothetical protein L2E82_43186 [Cichorium intybus]|uniref:Uncharacterized protein n=1 Tax=Cichorium intybus TaxID=13427 RepID=A0ACB8ZN26_CICIN|nr:hypothetical protein L2E82_43186 [Cichorium intybus]